MTKNYARAWTLAAATAIAVGMLSGCAGKVGRNLAFWKKPKETEVASIRPPESRPAVQVAAATSATNTTSYGEVPAGLQQNPVTSDSDAPVANSFRRAAHAVTDALAIEPTVVPPEDPVSLSNSPASVSSDLFLHAARVNEARGNLPLAREQYQKALELEPDNPMILVGLARLYDREGRLQEAEKVYRKAAAIAPNNPLVLNDLALCYARQGNLAQAKQSFEQTVRIAPQNVRYRNNLATVLVETGQPNDAFRHLAAVHPPAIAHYNLGQLLSQRKMDRESLVWFQRALQIDPTLAPARQMVEKLAGHPASRQPAPSNEGAYGTLSSGPRSVNTRPPYAGQR